MVQKQTDKGLTKMKTIDKIEKVKNMNVLLEDVGINRTFYWAYIRTQETTNENLDFEDVIWESDVEGIIKNCKEFGLKEITISSRFASLIDILAEFEKQGAKLIGLTKVTTRFYACGTNQPEIINALKIEI
jgi:hypothetical protein